MKDLVYVIFSRHHNSYLSTTGQKPSGKKVSPKARLTVTNTRCVRSSVCGAIEKGSIIWRHTASMVRWLVVT